jgi:hypothetical protein
MFHAWKDADVSAAGASECGAFLRIINLAFFERKKIKWLVTKTRGEIIVDT